MTENKDKFQEEYENLQNEIGRDRVKKAFAENPRNYREALEDIGSTWYDDDYSTEEEEERIARPENNRQRYLVSYFEGQTELSAAVLDALREERNSKTANHPLIRRYFRAANPYLKKLILFGLERDPTSLDLLEDLAFFNEFHRDLPELIHHFITSARAIEVNFGASLKDLGKKWFAFSKMDIGAVEMLGKLEKLPKVKI